MITWYCPGCCEPEWSRSGAEARDMIAHHKQHCPDYRGINFLKEKNRMSDLKLTVRDLEDSWACQHARGELTSDERVAEIRALLDEVRADAWDEGYRDGLSDVLSDGHPLFNDREPEENPYRKGKKDADE